MPTARELLDQADALMRRNRKRGKDRLGPPTLTDALDPRETTLAPTLILPDAAADPIALDPVAAEPLAPPGVPPQALEPMSLDTLGDLPVLTDAVLEWPGEDGATAGPGSGGPPANRLEEPAPHHPAIDVEAAPNAGEAGAPADAGDAFPASAEEAQAVAAELPAPAVLEREASEGESAQAPQPGPETSPGNGPRVPFLDDDFILELPPPDGNAPAPQVAPSPVAGAATFAAGSREWEALAEEIRMQVLQRLDLFTDTGLREQLGARLAPIVERASAQLIETINRELGELVRGYVAEAIEREIDSWRNQNPKP